MIPLPKPQAYRREHRQGSQFVRWAYSPNPPGTPLYTEGQVRALLGDTGAENRVYISGPITGMPDLNRAAFAETQAKLESLGYSVFNPLDKALPDSADWNAHMRADIVALMGCSQVAVLPGWRDSRGARLEVSIAHALGMPVKLVEQF